MKSDYNKYFIKFYIAIGILCSAVSIGILGFMLIEEYSFTDAFYMTIITISTVGYSEIKPLSSEGRIFTSILIISNIGLFFYSITALTSFMLEGDFRKFIKTYRMDKQLEKLTDHVIVCGFGRNGKGVCEVLQEEGVSFIIIEEDQSIVERIEQTTNYLVIHGDATHDDTLNKLKITEARGLVTTLPNDADNVYIVLSAREKNPTFNIVSRASIDASETKLRRAGADHVILPEKIGGVHMASILSKPDIMDFMAYISGAEEHDGTKLSLEGFSFESIDENLQYKSIKDLDVRKRTGANIIGLKNKKGEFIINPGPGTIIEPNIKLFVLGSAEEINNFKSLIKNI